MLFLSSATVTTSANEGCVDFFNSRDTTLDHGFDSNSEASCNRRDVLRTLLEGFGG